MSVATHLGNFLDVRWLSCQRLSRLGSGLALWLSPSIRTGVVRGYGVTLSRAALMNSDVCHWALVRCHPGHVSMVDDVRCSDTMACRPACSAERRPRREFENCSIEVAKSSFVVVLLALDLLQTHHANMSTPTSTPLFPFPPSESLSPALQWSLAAVSVTEAKYREVAAELANGIPPSWRARHRKQRAEFLVSCTVVSVMSAANMFVFLW